MNNLSYLKYINKKNIYIINIKIKNIYKYI